MTINPLTLGPTLWLDADDPTTITSSGGLVSTWADKSGNANDAVQTNGPSKPIYGATTYNSRNVLDFDGIVTQMRFPQSLQPTTTGGLTVMCVGMQNDAHLKGQVVTEGVAGWIRAHEFHEESGNYYISSDGANAGSNTTISSTDLNLTLSPFYATFTGITGATMGLRINGTAVTVLSGTLTTPTGATAGGDVGTRGGSYPWDGWIGEILAFPSILSGGDIAAVESYLVDKWFTPPLTAGGLHTQAHVPTAAVSLPRLWDLRVPATVSGAVAYAPTVALASAPTEAGMTVRGYRHPDYRTAAYTISDGMNREWQDRLTETGTGSITIPNDSTDRDLIECDDVIRFSVDGQARFSWSVSDDTATTIAPDEEANETTKFSGQGLLGLMSEAVVMPPLGADALPMAEDRLFSWPSPQFTDTGWRAATELTTVAGSVATWPLRFGGDTDHAFPDQNAPILGPSTGTMTSAPVGYCYFRTQVTIATTGHYLIYVAADNVLDFYVDGQHFTHSDDLRITSTVRIDLSAGTHTFAALVFSGAQLPPTPPTQNNPLGYAVAWYTAGTTGLPIALENHATAATTKIVEYPPTPPGMTPGEVIRIILDEAQTDSLLDGWTYTFDDEVDSEGNPWPTVGDIATKVGTDYRTFLLDELAQTYVDLRAHPGGLVLDAYVLDGCGTTTTVSLHAPTDDTDPYTGNLTELTHHRRAITATQLLVKWSGGWHLVDATPQGHRPKRAVLGLGAVQSVAEVERIAGEQLAVYAAPRQAITIGWEPIDTTDLPYEACVVGDTVTVPDRAGAPTVERILSFTVTEDVDGVIAYVAEIADVVATSQERWENNLKKMSDGTLRGDSRPAQPISSISVPGPSCCAPSVPSGG